MNFVEDILERLQQAGDRVVVQEAHEGGLQPTRGAELLDMVTTARAFLQRCEVAPGDRCAIIGPNGARWCALDLAVLAEGLIAVPLYHRQTPADVATALQDCRSAVVCCADADIADALRHAWPECPAPHTFDDIFSDDLARDASTETAALAADEPVTIIYTSGTSGPSKGVVLTRGNVEHMLPCTRQRLGELLADLPEPQRIFHYLPCCFAGSWILMLTALSRNSALTFSTRLDRLAREIQLARPHVFLNVPALLERIRKGIEERFGRRLSLLSLAFRRARDAHHRGEPGGLLAAVGRRVVFPAIRRRIGPDLAALICGSAPLTEDTQRFFEMLGLPVVQVYGLTETTAICTMDEVGRVQPGRVGRAIPGIDMKLGEHDEILVRGPHIFAGYWNRPDDTAAVMDGEWFRTGDQGEADDSGNWRIIGRLKNMIILNSGHNIVPDVLEARLCDALPGASQVMVVGNRRSHLAAIVTGGVSDTQVETELKVLNDNLPHYKRIHSFCVHREPFSQDNGLLTANGKLRRDEIIQRLDAKIEALYEHSTS